MFSNIFVSCKKQKTQSMERRSVGWCRLTRVHYSISLYAHLATCEPYVACTGCVDGTTPVLVPRRNVRREVRESLVEGQTVYDGILTGTETHLRSSRVFIWITRVTSFLIGLNLSLRFELATNWIFRWRSCCLYFRVKRSFGDLELWNLFFFESLVFFSPPLTSLR